MSRSYPIAVFQDRYEGCYSGGKWIAVAECDIIVELPRCKMTRFQFAFNGAHASDPEASVFGDFIALMDWIAVGDTPDEAIGKLRSKYETGS